MNRRHVGLAAAALGAALIVVPVSALGADRPATTLASVFGAGANVPFTEYEAEFAKTNGTTVAASRAYTSLAAEASGRRAVRLAAGQHLDITLARPADAVDVRYSIADGPDVALHASAGGHALPDLTLTARYSHYYGNYPFTNDPADGGEHHFFDDAHALLGTTLKAGTTVRFTATAATVVDLADFEVAGAPAAAPAGYLDATTFGADPTGAADSGPAIQDAIDAAEAAHTGVWLPAGTYAVTRQLIVDQVSVRGAGPWFTVLHGGGVGVFGKASGAGGSTGVHLAGFTIAGETTVRNDQIADSGLGGAMGGGSTVENLWIEHVKVGAWFDGPSDGLTLSHLRIQDVAADGINLHDGVAHTTVSDTFVRNTGDDGLAMWSDKDADHDNAFVRDTVQVPVLANGFAVYGGHDNAVRDSWAADTVTQGGGVHVGNRFGSVPLSGTTTIAGNVLVRTGDLVPNDPTEVGALWFYAGDSPMTGAIDVHDDTIVDSSYAAVQFYGKSITNVTIDRLAIFGAGTFAFQLQGPGAATVSHVTAVGLGRSGVYDCASGFALTRGAGDVGWSSTSCGFPPAGQLQIAQATGVDFGFQSLGSTTVLPLAITNPGPKPVSITGLIPPAGFTVPNTCATIAVGATCALSATFHPTASANYSGLLTIDSTSPAGPYVVLLSGVGFDPDGNLALGRTATASSQPNDYYGAYRLTDGDPGSYFESASNAFPQWATVDLGQTTSVDRIVLKLPYNWGGRYETIAVTTDGTTLVPAQDYLFDPAVSNVVTITFPATTLRTITLTFTGNTGWPAAQISEFEVYAH